VKPNIIIDSSPLGELVAYLLDFDYPWRFKNFFDVNEVVVTHFPDHEEHDRL